ncbi:MAG: ABC transporter ATP-binding protein [Candidatus Cloacimonadaceae bacterium]
MLKLTNLTCGYGDRDVLKGITLEINEHDFAVILGPNGAGKSTLLHTLIGYSPIREGSICIKGKPLEQWHKKDLARTLALIPQETVMPFDYTVREMVLMGRYPWLEMMQKYSAADFQIVDDILARLDLQELAERYFSQLSGGEKQRVLLARALAQQTEAILLDEALSQLDINHQVEMMRLLKEINHQDGKCILLVSHNINLAANAADRLILLKEGTVLANGTPEEVLTPALLKRLFGIDLILETNPLSHRPNIVFPSLSPLL